MKFYEFNQFEYYAMIAAKSKKSAMDIYTMSVDDPDENDLDMITEIDLDDAKNKLTKSINYLATDEAKPNLDQMKEEGIILIDSSLL